MRLLKTVAEQSVVEFAWPLAWAGVQGRRRVFWCGRKQCGWAVDEVTDSLRGRLGESQREAFESQICQGEGHSLDHSDSLTVQ